MESLPRFIGHGVSDRDLSATTDPEAALAGSLVSIGGYKGWGFGLMAELLAAGMTGGTVSRYVKPLKAPDGPPHDLGQFYILMEPGADFAARLARVAAAVAEHREISETLAGENIHQFRQTLKEVDANWKFFSGGGLLRFLRSPRNLSIAASLLLLVGFFAVCSLR